MSEFKDRRKALVEALRSGLYEQGVMKLHDKKTGKFCCLGVACEVAMKLGANVQITNSYSDVAVSYNHSNTSMPVEVRDFFGFRDSGGGYGNNEKSLMCDNDGYRKNFIEIAAIIESEPEGLFI